MTDVGAPAILGNAALTNIFRAAPMEVLSQRVSRTPLSAASIANLFRKRAAGCQRALSKHWPLDLTCSQVQSHPPGQRQQLHWSMRLAVEIPPRAPWKDLPSQPTRNTGLCKTIVPY